MQNKNKWKALNQKDFVRFLSISWSSFSGRIWPLSINRKESHTPFGTEEDSNLGETSEKATNVGDNPIFITWPMRVSFPTLPQEKYLAINSMHSLLYGVITLNARLNRLTLCWLITSEILLIFKALSRSLWCENVCKYKPDFIMEPWKDSKHLSSLADTGPVATAYTIVGSPTVFQIWAFTVGRSSSLL